jgi:Uncharacterized protein conserved in bacteria
MYGNCPYTAFRGYRVNSDTRSRSEPTGASRKKSRLEVRLTEAQKRLLQSAADVREESLTQFVIDVSETAARKELEKAGMLVLGSKDQEAFVKALLAPSEPNAQLSRAAGRYRKLIGSPRDR